MLNLRLPLFEKDASPSFTNAESCGRWITQFQLTDIRRAHQTLADELNELNRYDIPAIERLKITEQLRDSVSVLQEELSRRIFAKPLPLLDSELEVFRSIVGLWARMCTSYGLCLVAAIKGDQGVLRHQALLCQRCLRYTGYQLIQYLLVSYEADPLLWQDLHQFYRHAEDQGYARIPVMEGLLSTAAPSSCADHYIRVLLTYQANPYELSRKQLQALNRWLDEWVSWVTIVAEYPPDINETPPLMVNLASGSGPARAIRRLAGTGTRFLNVAELGKNLRVKIILLQQGQSAEQLGLGEEWQQGLHQSFLEHLLKYWCEGNDSREFERRSVNHPATLCFGMAAIHYRLSGAAFRQPKMDSKLSAREKNELFTFGRVVSRAGEPEPVYLEQWHIQDESHMGFRLIRESGKTEERLSPGYLVAIKAENGEQYQPCTVRWIIVGQSGAVNIGLKLLAGMAEAVALRATGINLTVSRKFVQAIMLRQPESKAVDSIVLPGGWFMPRKVVEVIDASGAVMQLKLESLVEKGANYDRARFSLM